MSAEVEHTEMFPDAAAAIAKLDETNQRIVLLRLAAKFNNGDEHFDHTHTEEFSGYSWLCLACCKVAIGHLIDRKGVA